MKTIMICIALAFAGCAAGAGGAATEADDDAQASVGSEQEAVVTCTFVNCLSECACYLRLCRAEAEPGVNCAAENAACQAECSNCGNPMCPGGAN